MKQLQIKRVKSVIGSKPNQRATVKALGLNKISKTVVKADTPTLEE